MKLKPRVKETRVFQFEKLNVEERSDGMGPKITGYAAVFNRWSENLGGFREKIRAGAFKKAIGKSDVRGLFNHDSNYVLGRQSNGTLQIKEDKNGLWMEIEPPDTQIIRDLVLSPIKRGDIKEQSFGFIVAQNGDKWDKLHNENDELAERTIIEIDELFDVSPVTFPAYPDTSIALRSMEKAKEPVFKIAEESDILNAALVAYLNAKEPTESKSAAYQIIERLLPNLNVEQRKELMLTLDPEGTPPDEGEGIEADRKPEGHAPWTDDRWQELDKRIAKITNL